MMRLFLLITASLISSVAFAQGCCSGGSGSPISGGAASGVLLKNQIELSTNYQFSQSNNFYIGSTDTVGDFKDYSTTYSYFRIDYGVSEKLTFSIASGYFLDKSFEYLSDSEVVSNSGIGDLIIFPRYNLYNKQKDNYRTEFSIGLGMKIPIGLHADSLTKVIENTTFEYDIPLPLILQRGTGGNDLLLYSFWYRGYHKRAFRVFANSLYIKKGYNAVGQKFGDYASVGIFASKTLWRNLGLTAQLKGECIKGVEGQNLLIDVASTGSKKLFFIPQISYSKKSLTAYVTSELPLYQDVNGYQIGSQWQFTMGVNYRFLAKKKAIGILE